MNIKKIIAKEGLLLVGVIIGAFHWAHSADIRSLMVDLGLPSPRLGEADAVIAEATRSGFVFLLLVYSIIRFIIWAIKTLRAK